jgi:hypothetical protein
MGIPVGDIRCEVKKALAGNPQCDWGTASTVMNCLLEVRNTCVINHTLRGNTTIEPISCDSADDVLTWKIFEIIEIDDE